MDTARYRSFFLQPCDPRHRQYEALRAVIVDEQPMPQVAQRLGYRPDTVRALVSRFRQQLDAGQRPPFSSRRSGGVSLLVPPNADPDEGSLPHSR